MVQYLDKEYDVKTSLLLWQKQGLMQTASGYGRKLTSSKMVRIKGEKVWRRVYIVCFSNSGSAYILVKGNAFYIRDSFMEDTVTQ